MLPPAEIFRQTFIALLADAENIMIISRTSADNQLL